MAEPEPSAAEAARDAVAQALKNVRETRAHYLALRSGGDVPQTNAAAAAVDEAARAVVAAEEQLDAARRALLAFFEG